jgi:peptide/nickel transport system substrate-binding protein
VIRRWCFVPAAVAVSVLLGACGSSGHSAATGTGSHGGSLNRSRDVTASTGTPVSGGTAYWAEQPLSPPNYIFPLVSGAYYSNENVNQFQTLLYRPLYWYGDKGKPGPDYALSLANAPVYSDRDRVVTITLKHAQWSDGEPVISRDVIFWLNLLKANKADWASYVPGGFPDNVVAWQPLGIRKIELRLNRSYNPIWFTNNELSQITPLPIAWDRTSLKGFTYPTRNGTGAKADKTPAGARAVYKFLNAQAKNLSGYATSPIWSVVDGPWKLTQLSQSGQATFVPNQKYDGPNKPRLAKFVELPFTSETAEFSVLKTGPTKGGRAGSTPQISVGYVPDTDVPQSPALMSQGYRLRAFYPYGFDYFEPNFNNPEVGPILKQLYFRQAFEHLVNQSGWIHAYYQGIGLPTYSPVPVTPSGPRTDLASHEDPYPFSVKAAAALLKAHGWKVVANGTTTCARAGSGSGECGAGIAAGKALHFTLMYPSGMSSTDGAMVDLQSVARRVGIQIALKEVTIATIDSEIEPCAPHTAACNWQLGQYGSAWVFAPDHYPTGEEIFQTGALGNVGSYSDPAIDKLIAATTTSPASHAQAALDAYADAVRLQLPDFWQPSPGALITTQSNLAGMTPNAYGFINPEEWYFTK